MQTALSIIIALTGTLASANPLIDRARRQDFVQRMEEAVGQNKRENIANRKLLRAAKLMSAPEFMKPRVLEENAQAAGDDYTYAIDLSQYALKYIGCSNIHTFSEELAAENADSVLEMNRFVILRLCPKDQCSNYYEYGCTSGYGDYLISMGEYLQIMSESYFKEYVEYCETCYSCLNPNANRNNDDGANNGYYGWSDYAKDDDAGGNCRYSEVCMNYWTACKDYSEDTYQLEDYFECSQFDMGGTSAYLAPHCGGDGKTLGIGVYSDKYCNSYQKDLSEVSSYLGMNIGDGYMKSFHSDNCISCLASDGYNLDANGDDDEISDFCYSLYGTSAKCNKYLGNNGDINSEVQEGNEEAVCTFIHNMMTNTYDEYGEIYLGVGGVGAYIRYASKFNSGQKWFLSFSILLVIGMAAYAAFLHKAVMKNREIGTEQQHGFALKVNRFRFLVGKRKWLRRSRRVLSMTLDIFEDRETYLVGGFLILVVELYGTCLAGSRDGPACLFWSISAGRRSQLLYKNCEHLGVLMIYIQTCMYIHYYAKWDTPSVRQFTGNG
eukprot:scaffold22610_cov115-Cylindrotheca_fusiformis.AAC.2